MMNKTYSQMRDDFISKYTEIINPIAITFEKERKIRLIAAMILAPIPSIIAAALIVFVTVNYKNIDFEKGGAELIILLYMLFYASWSIWFGFKKKFENKIKPRIMPAVCKCLGNLKWTLGSSPKEGSRQYNPFGSYIEKTGLVPKFDFQMYDDMFTGEFRGVKIKIIEAEYLFRTQKGGSVTVFDGVIVVLDMNKNFSGNTIVTPKFSRINVHTNNLEKILLEDNVFSSKFNVYSDDQIEARYLLNPSFMEKLKNMKVAFGAKKVSCAFYHNSVLVGLHTKKDIFSVGSLVKPMSDGTQFFRMYEEIISIVKLIDYFKLDMKIGI